MVASSTSPHLPYYHSICDLALAYIDEVVADHTPVNLRDKVAREGMRMIPVPPDLRGQDQDEFFGKETLVNAILSIYDFLCGGDESKMRSMLDRLLK